MWFKENITIDDVNAFSDKNMTKHLDIKFTKITDDSLIGEMSVSHKTTQPFNSLHGGASVVLAESLGSITSNLIVNPKTHYAVGMSINASHVSSVRIGGCVYGEAKAIHIGKSSHVWEINIFNKENEKLVCSSRLTTAVIRKKI